jgi:hypothetical protein
MKLPKSLQAREVLFRSCQTAAVFGPETPNRCGGVTVSGRNLERAPPARESHRAARVKDSQVKGIYIQEESRPMRALLPMATDRADHSWDRHSLRVYLWSYYRRGRVGYRQADGGGI